MFDYYVVSLVIRVISNYHTLRHVIRSFCLDFVFLSDLVILKELFLKEGILYSSHKVNKHCIFFFGKTKLILARTFLTSVVHKYFNWLCFQFLTRLRAKLSNFNYKSYKYIKTLLILFCYFEKSLHCFLFCAPPFSSHTYFEQLKFIRDNWKTVG